MTSLQDYTRKLLYEHDCVVLPELGGFLAYFSHAFYSEQNELYHAPQKRVAFNEALKLDDGLLVHYLTINEQITREEAQKKVRGFVETVKNTIKETGSFTLQGIGTLESNDEGKLQFEPVNETNFYAEGFGLKSLQVSPVKAAVKAEESESAIDWTAADRSAEELPFELPRRRRSRVALYIGGVLLLGATLAGAVMQIPSESLKSSLNPFELATTVKGWVAADKKSDVDKEILPAPVPKAVAAPEVKAITPPAVTVAPVKENKIAVSPAKNKHVSAPGEPSAVISLKTEENAAYWVIAGGFSKLENARKLENKLRRNGFENAAVLNPEPVDGKLIIVTAIGCQTTQKAKTYLAAVSRLAGANAYVTHQ